MTRFDKRVWGWMFFDWACQPCFTLLLTFIFAPYFTSVVVGDDVLGQQYWGWMLTFVGIFIALLAPVLGAVSDGTGTRNTWIVLFSAMLAIGTFSLWWATPGGSFFWPLVAFGIGLIGAEFATVMVNAMLPSLGSDRDVGLISGSGWAFGYAGGLVSLAIVLLFVAEDETGRTLLGNLPAFGLDPEAREGTRSVGPFTAIWFLVFMVPFFMWSFNQPTKSSGSAIRGLLNTLRNLPNDKSLLAFLGSSMFYRDALTGVYSFGGIYAAGVLNWSIVQIGIFGVASLISGTIFAWLGGFADRKWGPKTIIVLSSVTLIFVCVVVFSTTREMVIWIPVALDSSMPDIVFMICGCIIGGSGGALQASSRTMMVTQANHERMTEAFGLYAFAGKATSFLAPFLIATTTALTMDQRLGVTPLIFLFIIGLVLLIWVDSQRKTA